MADKHPIKGALPQSQGERVVLNASVTGKKWGFAVFLIGCALLLAAFAVSALWMKNGGADWFLKNESPSETQGGAETNAPDGTAAPIPPKDSNVELPAGAVPIVDRDLSYPALGQGYLHNETPYRPNVAELLEMELDLTSDQEGPLVLILHTHSSEGYLPDGTSYIEGSIGDATYTDDITQNVLSVGEVLCQTLNENGVPAIHCNVIHDDPTLSGSYERAQKTVREYLTLYPSIVCVIDLHRDAITTSDGEFVRSAVPAETDPTAQVMAVVGTDANGTLFAEGWERNLALALQLRELLNADGAALGRPVSLRNASYNQELAPYFLLLEIGTAANSPKEAERAAVSVGKALGKLFNN